MFIYALNAPEAQMNILSLVSWHNNREYNWNIELVEASISVLIGACNKCGKAAVSDSFAIRQLR